MNNIPSIFVVVAASTLVTLSLTRAVPSSAAPATPVSVTHSLSDVRTGQYKLDHDHARIVWNVSHHGYSTFSAMFSDVEGTLSFDAADPTRSKLDATVSMNSVGTFLPEFDGRLKGAPYFNTAMFPTARFVSTRIERLSATGLRVTGNLTFLGVTRQVDLEATFNQAGQGMGPPGYRVGFDGRLVVKRSDFGMTPSNLTTVGDAVTLQIEAEFQEAGAPSPH
jgi:polyisoprenoid-binding protein YceI